MSVMQYIVSCMMTVLKKFGIGSIDTFATKYRYYPYFFLVFLCKVVIQKDG